MRKKNPKPVEINASFNEGTSSNSSDLQTPTETKLPLKEDKRKRKTWIWVPVVEEERKEPENIETNSRGRAVRNSKKKAAENISASLTRKTTTIASTKETKNVRRREASLINITASANDEQESSLAVNFPVATGGELIEEAKNEDKDAPKLEESLTNLSSSAVDEPENHCMVNTLEVMTVEEQIEEPMDAIQRETSLINLSSSEVNGPENECVVDNVSLTTMEKPIEESQCADNVFETTMEDLIEESVKEEDLIDESKKEEICVNADTNEVSLTNILSSATNDGPQSQDVADVSAKISDELKEEKIADELKEDVEVDVLALDEDQVPRSEWPAFPEYKKIEENLMLCPDAESRECKSLQCECNPSSKEKKRGMACGEECLNRLLLMECGDECRSGKYCTNKRFQNREYAGLEVFFTGPKGWGLRTKTDISPGRFIIEYMGEIVDTKEVLRRIRRYGKDPNHKHHYLMALRNGTLIDATVCGNDARFINHSCEPNAATQKWTVGRQLRIGFFAIRTIRAGEEVTFNYQFERYGKKAQKCFCESSKCTGFIGGTKEDSGVDSNEENENGEESDTSVDSISSTDEEEKIIEAVGISEVKISSSDSKIDSAISTTGLSKKRGRPRKYPSAFSSFLDINRSTIARLKGHGKHHHKHHQRSFVSGDTTIREQSEVNEILLRGPLRNRDQVLEFNRLMVRVDQMESRRRMVDFLLRIDDPNILRLFVANQGFALIRIWFVLPSFERRALQLQSQIARLLMRLPVTNKNQVDEVCIMSTLKQMLIFELPDRLIIKEKLASIVDEVVADVDGINNQVSASSSKLGQAQTLAREVESLKGLAAQLADKWGKLVDWGFKIPKKLVESIKESSSREESKSRPKNERHRQRSDSVRSSDSGHKSINNRSFDRFPSSNKIEMGSVLKPPLHQQPPNCRYQRFQNHYRKFINCPQNNTNFVPPQKNFNQCNRQNDHGGDDYLEDDEKRQFEEWKKFHRFQTYGPGPDIFSNPYFAMSVGGMPPQFIPPSHLPHPAQVAAALFAISGPPPPPAQFPLPLPPPPPQQQQTAILPPPPPPARPTPVSTQNLLPQTSSQATLPPPPPPSQSANSSTTQMPSGGDQLLTRSTTSPCPSYTTDQQKDEDNNSKTTLISAIPTPKKSGFLPPITRKNRTKDDIVEMDNKMENKRIPDLIMAVCSPEYNKDDVDTDKAQDSNIKEELLDEKINISTVEKEEVEKQTIEPAKRTSERYKKSSKEVQAEMLQRRLKSLRAALGQKASQSHWPDGEGDKNSSRTGNEMKQSDSKHSEAAKTTNSKSPSPSRDGRRSHYQNEREVRERRRSGERRSQYFSNRGERRTQRDERFHGRGCRFGNGNQNYCRGRRQSFNVRRRFNGGRKRSYDISPERTNTEGKVDGDSNCEQRKRSLHEEKDRLKRGDSAGIKAQIVKKAVEQQQNKADNEREKVLSVSEKVDGTRKAEINTIAEKLKTIVQPHGTNESDGLKTSNKKKTIERKRRLSNDEDSLQSSDDDSSSTISTSSTSSDSLTTSSSILAEVETKTKTLLASGKIKDSLALDKNPINLMQQHLPPFSITPTIRSIKTENITTEKEIDVPAHSSRGHFLPLQITSDPEQQKSDAADMEIDSSDELDSTDMMQPPQISVSILQDPPKLDAYIHQLKEHSSQLPVAIRVKNTATSTTTLQVKKRTHSNDQNQDAACSTSNIPVIKRARMGTGTVSTNPTSNSNNPPIVLQPRQENISRNIVQQLQQHQEKFSATSSGDQPSHSNTPPEDPRISNREPTLNAMNDNTFGGQTEYSVPQHQLSLSNVTTIPSASNALINHDEQNLANAVNVEHNAGNVVQTSATVAADSITVTKTEVPVSEANHASTSDNPSTTTSASTNPSATVQQLVTKSGIWLVAKDTDGTPYFYHKDTREARWDLPPGEELIDLNAVVVNNEDSLQNPLLLQQRRAEFKRQVSALVAKCIEAYRKRFFPNPNEYSGFLRKITHKVLDSQEGNKELIFNIQVQKNTRRLVDDYIKHFKVRESSAGYQVPI
uniref:Histone-lysine N-methyltransferase n=1 Tax=Meloidogyne javanica TaxID=6303 RepID=A0A915LCG5_MELJA